MVYGYCRVSTQMQARDGNSLEAQKKLLIENGAEKIYSDAFTGTKAHRPELDCHSTHVEARGQLRVSSLFLGGPCRLNPGYQVEMAKQSPLLSL